MYCNHAPKRIASTTPYSQGFMFPYRHSRCRLGSPWVGPTNAAQKRHKLATVIPGATSTLSASSTYYLFFLCRCSVAFSSSFTHAAINLQPPLRTVLYQTPRSTGGIESIVRTNYSGHDTTLYKTQCAFEHKDLYGIWHDYIQLIYNCCISVSNITYHSSFSYRQLQCWKHSSVGDLYVLAQQRMTCSTSRSIVKKIQ